MPRRHRYTTGDELISLLTEDDLDTALVRHVVDRPAELGVAVDTLVRITVDEQLGG